MEKKVAEILKRWLDNGLINQETYQEIVHFEENLIKQEGITNQRSKVARAMKILTVHSSFILAANR